MSADELTMLCELAAVASLCSWVAYFAVGLGVCAPDRALLTGVPGTFLGGALFEVFDWPVGVTVAGYPLVPAMVGTTLLLVLVTYGKRLRDDRGQRRYADEQRDLIRPFREWPGRVPRTRP